MRHPISALALVLAVPGAAASASEGGGAESLHLVPMDEVSVPIIDGNRTDGAVQFKLVLEAKDEAAAQAVKASLPLLRSASISAGLEFARLYASPMMPLDARRLATEMSAALHRQQPGITRVLLVEVAASRG